MAEALDTIATAAREHRKDPHRMLAERLFDIALGKCEWVRQSGGSKYACPLCGGISERDGGPGHQDGCERNDIIAEFDKLYPPAKGR